MKILCLDHNRSFRPRTCKEEEDFPSPRSSTKQVLGEAFFQCCMKSWEHIHAICYFATCVPYLTLSAFLPEPQQHVLLHQLPPGMKLWLIYLQSLTLYKPGFLTNCWKMAPSKFLWKTLLLLPIALRVQPFQFGLGFLYN
jgi:hypothetical protein